MHNTVNILLCASIMWSAGLERSEDDLKLTQRSSTTVALGPTESLLVTGVNADQIIGVLVNPDNAISVRSVAIDSSTGLIAADPVDGQYTGRLVSYVRTRGSDNEVVATQASTKTSAFFEVRSPHQDPLRFQSANSIPSLVTPLMSSSWQTVILPSTITEHFESRVEWRENFVWASLREGFWEVSSLVFEAKVVFNSYRLAADRAYFLRRSKDGTDLRSVGYVDLEAGRLVMTGLHAVDIVPCSCGLWALNGNGQAVLYDSDKLGEDDREDGEVCGDKILASQDAIVIFGRHSLGAIGGISSDGSFWSHQCNQGIRVAAPFIEREKVASLVRAGWVLHRDAFWIQTKEDMGHEVDFISVEIYDVARRMQD